MTVETSALTLIRTKMQRPRLPGDLVSRRRLLGRLCAGSSRKLTLISARAGAIKESNWLPAPDSPFSLQARLYWPEPEALDPLYVPPPVRKAQRTK